MEKLTKEIIIETLKEVYDPEIPINIYDLGLIYEINILEKEDMVDILMSLTSPTCPTADYIKEMVQTQVENLGVKTVNVEITFDPLWTSDRISPEAKDELGFGEDNLEDSNIGVQNMFFNENSNYTPENICFNCGVDDDKYPLIKVLYKKENVFICTKCIVKFQ